MKKFKTAHLLTLIIFIMIFNLTSALAADNSKPIEVLKAIKNFYFKDNSDFALNFKVISKNKDISFDGSFTYKAPAGFLIDAQSAALKIKLVFDAGKGFIYLPAANMITNIDKLTQAKAKSITIPQNVSEIDSKITQLESEFDLKSSEEGSGIKLTGKSKKSRGTFEAVIDKSSYELKTLSTFNAKGNQEISIDFKDFKHVKADGALFEKPKNAVETNLPVSIF